MTARERTERSVAVVGSDLSQAIRAQGTLTSNAGKTDPMFLVKLGNTETYSLAGMSFLVVGSGAYVYAEPWYIAFFSGGLLIGSLKEIRGNLAPGCCPFRTRPTATDIVVSMAQFAPLLNLYGGKPEIALIEDENVMPSQETPTTALGLRPRKADTRFYQPNADNLQYTFEKYSLTQLWAMILAETISLLLSVVVGLVVLYALLLGLQMLINCYIDQFNRLYAYRQRIHMSEREYQSLSKKKQDQMANEQAASSAAGAAIGSPTERSAGSVLSVIGLLPSPYALIDMLVRKIQRALTSSAYLFCNLLFVEVRPGEINDYRPMPYRTLKKFYQQYCFLTQQSEEYLIDESTKKHFRAKGYDIQRSFESHEILKNVRWANADEKRKHMEQRCMQRKEYINSLERFVQTHCMVTPFETDTIEFEKFLNKYNTFCEKKHLQALIPSRALLRELYKIDSFSTPLYYLHKLPEVQKREYRPCLEHVVKLTQRAIKVTQQENNNEFTIIDVDTQDSCEAYIYDIVSVLLHLIVTFFLSTMIFLIALYVEMEQSKYTLSDYEYKMMYEDFSFAPWNIGSKVSYLGSGTKVCLGLSTAFLCLSFIDLCFYPPLLSIDFACDACRFNLDLLRPAPQRHTAYFTVSNSLNRPANNELVSEVQDVAIRNLRGTIKQGSMT